MSLCPTLSKYKDISNKIEEVAGKMPGTASENSCLTELCFLIDNKLSELEEMKGTKFDLPSDKSHRKWKVRWDYYKEAHNGFEHYLTHQLESYENEIQNLRRGLNLMILELYRGKDQAVNWDEVESWQNHLESTDEVISKI